MQKVEKPWGYEVIWAKTDSYVAKFLHINPNSRLSLQYHEEKEETIYVMSGQLSLQLGENSSATEVGPCTVIHVQPGRIHRFGANSQPVVLCEVSSPQIDDVVRIQDDYARLK